MPLVEPFLYCLVQNFIIFVCYSIYAKGVVPFK